MHSLEEINKDNLPKHIAVIMDGNGRWAKERGKLRMFGHEHGVKAVRRTVENCTKLGIQYLTLYAFSTENWNRPKIEVQTLMRILVSSLRKELKTFQDNNIRLNAIGDLETLPPKAAKELQEVMQKTDTNTGMTLTLALSYGSRNEFVNAVKNIGFKVKNNLISPDLIDEQTINSHLYTHDMPDVDLVIRTSGEHRISNFLLWQIAYAEFYFIDVFWPDFAEAHLAEAIISYQKGNEDLEKQANNLTEPTNKPTVTNTILIFLLLFSAMLFAQEGDSVSLENPKKLILGGLEVTGVKTYNEQTVKTFTGLRVGQPITIPGEETSAVIKKLWDLDLFSDIKFYITGYEGDKVFLELNITERPTLTEVTIYGIKDRKKQDILNDTDLKKGKKLTESLIANTKSYLENKYKKQGYLNARVTIATAVDTSQTNAESMVINIKKGEKVKVSKINFVGNDKVAKKKLAKALKNTKQKKFYRFWKKSKYIAADYQEDLGTLVDAYAERGYRDARVISDTVVKVDDNNIELTIEVQEGNKYYFGDIDFVGNTVYNDRFLSQVLGIKKGDTYNGVLLKKRVADDTKPDAVDITNQYQNNGYLFSRINPVEVSAINDTIDFEIRIIEGKETFLNHITVVGNDKTNDHVILENYA